MLQIDIITLFPEMVDTCMRESIVGRAQAKEIAKIRAINLRDYSLHKRKNVDDYQYGGGAGMVMMVEPIVNCIEALKAEINYDHIIYMSPDGQNLTQGMSNSLSMYQNLLILCGHYKGVDERVRENFITMEISVGDFVLSGGELAACVLTDSIVRLIPGAISDETSALSDSFQDGLVSPPVYTRPAEFRGLKVPEILLSGDQKLIEQWRHDQAILRTKERRPDLLRDESDDSKSGVKN